MPSGEEWLGMLFLAVGVSVLSHALEHFLVGHGCCESECIVRRRARAASPRLPASPRAAVESSAASPRVAPVFLTPRVDP